MEILDRGELPFLIVLYIVEVLLILNLCVGGIPNLMDSGFDDFNDVDSIDIT